MSKTYSKKELVNIKNYVNRRINLAKQIFTEYIQSGSSLIVSTTHKTVVEINTPGGGLIRAQDPVHKTDKEVRAETIQTLVKKFKYYNDLLVVLANLVDERDPNKEGNIGKELRWLRNSIVHNNGVASSHISKSGGDPNSINKITAVSVGDNIVITENDINSIADALITHLNTLN